MRWRLHLTPCLCLPRAQSKGKLLHMTSNQIRQRFLDFFAKREHAVLPSAPLIPEADGGDRNVTLFNVAGMQPLMPYLLGEEHPDGKRLASNQVCLRTNDIDEVGDNTHATFFEMLGNWSLGDYYKEDAIKWSYEFLTNKDEGLGLDVNRLYVTVFAPSTSSGQVGGVKVEVDEEAADIWRGIFNEAGLDPEKRIFYLPSKSNWWTAGPNSPAGPSTEMFYDLTGELTSGLTHDEFVQADDEQKVVEIWNDVFMAYRQENGEVVAELPNKNVDTGSGLERLTAVVQGKRSIFDTDLFLPIIQQIEKLSQLEYGEKSDDYYKEKEGQCWVDVRKKMRIIADHIKAATFLSSEGLTPSNTDRGYILRRLIRRAVAHAHTLGAGQVFSVAGLTDVVVGMYGEAYPELLQKKGDSKNIIDSEEKSFKKTLEQGLKEFEKGERDAFILFTTFGFPLEMTMELAKEKGEDINVEEFEKKMEEHKKLSQSSSVGQFKGGLADAEDPKVVQLHTAHHLLLAALQQVLGAEVKQRGSNITAERLRLDFTFERKMTDEEKAEVEKIVNEKIQESLPVVCKEMPREEAEALGAEMEFGQKYPDMVSVYLIGPASHEATQDNTEKPFSIEFCGGPHIENTSELGVFKIKKEEASSKGVRRIKAVLE